MKDSSVRDITLLILLFTDVLHFSISIATRLGIVNSRSLVAVFVLGENEFNPILKIKHLTSSARFHSCNTGTR